VLPVTGLVLVVLVLAALAFPAFRHQVAMSTTRQPQPFVELYFSKSHPADHVACGREVRFTVVSHLQERRRLRYDVHAGPAERNGTVLLRPGQSRQVRVPVDAPAAHLVGVRLPALGQHLLLHCDGTR
jgi:hypothetical protein